MDTILGFWRLGFNVFSVHMALLVHAAFSYATAPSILPDPFLRIYTGNIHRGKHGGDSNTYDNEGRFVPQEFENMFAKYADSRDYMTLEDVWRLNRGQRLHADPFGAIMSIFWCK
jgi:peroxygenase